MPLSDKLWQEITPSELPWEREALQFVRNGLPDHEPYRAWSSFEFIGQDGSLNEVDLLVVTPKGFFLVEIKSRPGILAGHAGTWRWVTEGSEYVSDNPLRLANRKAQREVDKVAELIEGARHCGADELVPDISAKALAGLKFADCLPDRLAQAVLRRRWWDAEAVKQVLGSRPRATVPPPYSG